MFQVQVESTSGRVPIDLYPGSVTLIVGPNGVGKSALLQDIYRLLPSNLASYYPGHRQITFSHGWENMQMSLSDLDTNLFSSFDSFNRYKSVWPEEQFKSVLRRLQNSEAAYNQEMLERMRHGANTELTLALRQSPMQLLNSIFQTARMPVRFKITDLGLTVTRDGAEYGVDRLSDGERASLFIASAVVNRTDNGVIIIDEPERHLHPSISAPLISSAVRSRPDISYVFASHDLNLIETLEVDNFLYIRNSQLITDRPERRIYDFRHVGTLDQVSPDLKRDILGVRDKVLFVEGEVTSLDSPLYSACYPGWKVAPRGGHDKVQEAVKALNSNAELHWMEVVGIIDGDGRDADEIQKLREGKIITLSVPTVENLYFLPQVVEEVCKTMTEAHGGDYQELYAAADASVSQILNSDAVEIVARRATWLINRKLSEQKTSVDLVREGNIPLVTVDLAAIKSQVQLELDQYIAGAPTLQSLLRLPIKNTGIPGRIAGAIGLKLKKYKQTVLHQIEINSAAGQVIKRAVMSHLPVLP